MSNKRIDFTKLGGFPLTQDTLAFMQLAYQEAVAGLAKLAGDNVIVSGMADNGTAVTDGWILVNGELLPFQAGNKQTYFIITETTGDETFEDDSVKTVYYTRQARFGSGAGQIAYASLTRLDDLKTLNANVASLAASLTALSQALTAHEADMDNPHGVTADQVGLGNLPNAKSDSYTLDDSDTLATSKAVNDGVKANEKIIYVGSKYIGNPTVDQKITVAHNQNIGGNYIVAGSLRSAGSSWNNDNDTIWMVRNLQADSFELLTREFVNESQTLYFDYALIALP